MLLMVLVLSTAERVGVACVSLEIGGLKALETLL